MTKQDIEKLNSQLKKGDKTEISQLAGFSRQTINKFFKGKEESLTDQTMALIIDATAKVIRKRNQLNAKSERILNSI